MSDTAAQRLRQELDLLEVSDVLALCYCFGHSVERLRLYLDILRSKGGDRAQFASSLICFELARLGDESAQREFLYLAGTIYALSHDDALVQSLLADDAYLTEVWGALKNELAGMDTRFDATHLTRRASDPEETVVIALPLLSDADVDGDFAEVLTDDDVALQRQLDRALDAFFGADDDLPVYDPDGGFRLNTRADANRVDQLLQELDSLRGPMPLARGYRALTLLFYGTHVRSKSLFGKVNEHKQELLRDGLREFLESGDQMWRAAGAVGSIHADADVWHKVSEVLLDYLRWTSRVGSPETANPDDYPVVERQVERDRKRGGRRGSKRW